MRHQATIREEELKNRVCGYALTNSLGRGVDVAIAYDGSYVTNMTYVSPNGSRFAASLTRKASRKQFIARRDYSFDDQPTYWYATDYDLLGRPTNAMDSVSLVREWLYNRRSELASASIGPNLYGYAYDTIGNRLWSADNLVTNTYVANSLNQYSSILRDSESLRETTYDIDGNLTSDGVFSYSYDAENRLLSATATEETNGAFRVINAYDHRNRRIGKTVQRLSVSYPPPPSPPIETREWNTIEYCTFAYDDWNLIHETVATIEGGTTNTTEVQYFWGLDLSDSLQGAGGVGGLLAVSSNGQFYFPTYDNNGNITKYLDESGNVVTAYEYDDFGRLVSQSGSLAAFFRHRFSTKYFDSETGLYYYGYRFYSPDWRIWLNRDPIEEKGGENLHCFVLNCPLNNFDATGLERLSLSYDFAMDTSFIERMLNWSTHSRMTVSDVEKDILQRVNPYGKSGKTPCKCIEHVILAGHGHEGAITLGEGEGKTLTGLSFRVSESNPYFPSEIFSLLSTLKNVACDRMTVEFATCLSGKGEAGRDLRSELTKYFGDDVSVILYDREIRFYFNYVH